MATKERVEETVVGAGLGKEGEEGAERGPAVDPKKGDIDVAVYMQLPSVWKWWSELLSTMARGWDDEADPSMMLFLVPLMEVGG